MLETKIICKLDKLVTIKRRTVIRLDNLRNHKWQMHDVTLEGPLSQKLNAKSQLQEILSNHQSLLEHNVLLLHKSKCSLVTKDHQAEGSFSTVPRRVLV